MARRSKTGKPESGPKTPDHDTARHELEALKAKIRALVSRANTGDRAALEELRRVLDLHPEVHALVGDLTRLAESAWLDLLTSGDVLTRESVQRQLGILKADLAGSQASVVEKLLVDEVGICYLASRHAEIAAASPPGAPLTQAVFRLRRAESAQRRFLGAMKALVTFRALMPQGLAPVQSLRLFDPDNQPTEAPMRTAQ